MQLAAPSRHRSAGQRIGDNVPDPAAAEPVTIQHYLVRRFLPQTREHNGITDAKGISYTLSYTTPVQGRTGRERDGTEQDGTERDGTGRTDAQGRLNSITLALRASSSYTGPTGI